MRYNRGMGERVKTAAQIAAGVGLIAADLATGGLLNGIPAPPGWLAPPDRTPELLAALAETTAAPRRTADGRVLCTGCDAAVSWDTITLSDQGYFCAVCAPTGGRPSAG
jgi:hypothetical protein